MCDKENSHILLSKLFDKEVHSYKNHSMGYLICNQEYDESLRVFIVTEAQVMLNFLENFLTDFWQIFMTDFLTDFWKISERFVGRFCANPNLCICRSVVTP